jgi:ketosteroid isomerase-like protein
VFDWLYEGRPAVYVLLGGAAALLLVVWKRTPRRVYLQAAAACLVLLGVYYLLDRQVETDREQISRKITEMAGAVQARDLDRIFRHISESFRLGGADRAAFRREVENVFSRNLVERVEVWNFQFPDDFREKRGSGPAAEESARVEFFAKPFGGVADNATYYLVRARMRRDPDGQWRLQTYQVFNPYSGSNEPLVVPHLPN